MRDAALLGARLLLGGYMGIHASQKLFGMFHGPGLDGIGQVFEKNGLTPGREMAMAAAATATRVLPTPPGPTIVTSRNSASMAAIPASSSCLPTKSVYPSCGNRPATEMPPPISTR